MFPVQGSQFSEFACIYQYEFSLQYLAVKYDTKLMFVDQGTFLTVKCGNAFMFVDQGTWMVSWRQQKIEVQCDSYYLWNSSERQGR